MYESHFQFKRRPFSAAPDPECVFITDETREILAELIVCTERAQGLGVLTGAAGTGKTLLCHRIADELTNRLQTVFLKNANFATRRSFLQSLMYELGQPYSGLSEQELRLELTRHSESTLNIYDGIAVIVDEAHLLSARLLEEIRGVMNLSVGGNPLVRFILCGLPELEETLASPALSGLSQRIAAQKSIELLTRSESVSYIEYRTNWGGANPQQVFTPEALDAIAFAADGLPRCLNQLCDHSLLLAFAAGLPQVSTEIVNDALEDLRRLPLHWNERPQVVGPLDALSSSIDEETVEEPAVEDSTTEEYSFDSYEAGEYESIEIGAIEIVNDDEEQSSEELSLPESMNIGEYPLLLNEEADEEQSVEADAPEAPSIEITSGVVPLVSDQRRNPVMFEEEPVIDRYAALDAEREIDPTVRSIEIAPRTVEASEPEVIPVHESPNEVSETPVSAEQSETVVLEVPRSPRQSIIDQINDLDFGEIMNVATERQGFDVVQPERERSEIKSPVVAAQAPVVEQPTEELGSGAVPPPNMRRLFSRLRRVHHEHSAR